MIYCLLHCYSDNNKGDLGIVLGTIKAIRENDKEAKIIAISTYNYDDPMFISDHVLLKPYVDELLPAFFGIINNKNKSGNDTGLLSKVILGIKDGIRYYLFLKMTDKKINNYFVDAQEKNSIEKMISADFIISKGGSFICNENNIREKLGLYRILYPFFLCQAKEKQYYLLGQSIGPIYGKKSISLSNKVIEKSKRIFLREKRCIKEYPYLRLTADNIEVGRDCAFLYDSIDDDNFAFKKTKGINIGITLKYTAEEKEYNKMILGAIKHLVKRYKANVFLITHVHVDNDGEKSQEIFQQLNPIIRKNVEIIDQNYSVSELRGIYKQMEFNICTRLHSAIFSLSTETPAICIAYHGTKAQGVFELLELEKFVITQDNYNEEKLIGLIDDIIANKDIIRQSLKKEIPKTKELVNIMVENIIAEKLVFET